MSNTILDNLEFGKDQVFEEFFAEIKRMNHLYLAGWYTGAEELRNKLAEELDDVMRLKEELNSQ